MALDYSLLLYLCTRKKKPAKRARETRVSLSSLYRSSLLFCTGVQFSRDSIRAFNDRIQIQKSSRLWTVYAVACWLSSSRIFGSLVILAWLCIAIINRRKFLPTPAICIACYVKPDRNKLWYKLKSSRRQSVSRFARYEQSICYNLTLIFRYFVRIAIAADSEFRISWLTVWRYSIIHVQTEFSKANYHGDIYGGKKPLNGQCVRSSYWRQHYQVLLEFY